MATSSAKAEEHVRRYLTYLRSPQDLLDQKILDRAQGRVDRAAAGGDVIEHVMALAAQERAQVVDEAPLRAAFVGSVPGWAEEHGVSVEVLHSVGVSYDVLVEAGLMSREHARRLRSGANTRKASKKTAPAKTPAAVPDPVPVEDPPASATNGHGRGVDYDALVELLPPKGQTFRATDLAQLLGVDPSTARNRIAGMRAKGLIEHLGEVDPWNEKGSPPYLYGRI